MTVPAPGLTREASEYFKPSTEFFLEFLSSILGAQPRSHR